MQAACARVSQCVCVRVVIETIPTPHSSWVTWYGGQVVSGDGAECWVRERSDETQ